MKLTALPHVCISAIVMRNNESHCNGLMFWQVAAVSCYVLSWYDYCWSAVNTLTPKYYNWRRGFKDHGNYAYGPQRGFDLDSDDWPEYAERMEEMFFANEIVGEAKAEKRRSVFLSVVGKRTYTILRSLLSPDRPSTHLRSWLQFWWGILVRHHQK